MMVDVTPGEVLNKRIEKAARKNKIKKVVERVRITVKGLLQRSAPFKKNRCSRKDCVPGLTQV